MSVPFVELEWNWDSHFSASSHMWHRQLSVWLRNAILETIFLFCRNHNNYICEFIVVLHMNLLFYHIEHHENVGKWQ